MSIEQVENSSRAGDHRALQAAFEARLSQPTADQFEISKCMGAFQDAVDANNISIAAVFLDHGLSANSSRLRAAIENKQYNMLQLFLDHGWDINQPLGRHSPPALEFAVDNETMVKWFLNHGADPNAGCESGDTLLSSAVERGLLSAIRLLLDHGGDTSPGYLLQRAVYRKKADRIDVLKFLLDEGVPINMILYQDHMDQYLMMAFANLGTPLHEDAERGLLDAAALLVQRGADPLIEDCKGLTAIERAERTGHPEIAQLLRDVAPPSSRNTFTRGRQAGIDLIY